MRCVLIVEDESITAMDMADLLRSNGYEIEIARDGKEALERVKRKSYDLIISNNKSPGMSGEQLYEHIFALNRESAKKVVFISAYINDFIKSTGNPFLVKPYSDDRLLETVKGLIP